MFEKLREKLTGIAKENEEEIIFPNLDEGLDLKNEVEKTDMPEEAPKSSIEGNNIELKVIKPESISEVSTIADHLLDGCTVVLNLELLDIKQITRLLDFLRGVSYTIGGEIKHVSKSTYILTAKGIDISEKG